MIRLLTQAIAHYGSQTGEAINDVASEFRITPEQVSEVIRWIESQEFQSNNETEVAARMLKPNATAFETSSQVTSAADDLEPEQSGPG